MKETRKRKRAAPLKKKEENKEETKKSGPNLRSSPVTRGSPATRSTRASPATRAGIATRSSPLTRSGPVTRSSPSRIKVRPMTSKMEQSVIVLANPLLALLLRCPSLKLPKSLSQRAMVMLAGPTAWTRTRKKMTWLLK